MMLTDPRMGERLEFVEEFARFARVRRRGDGWLEFIAGGEGRA